MTPSQFHGKREMINGFCPTPLKINKESHFIKKSSSSPPSSFSTTAAKPQQQRHPVIIYTHSPKIIHTHPRDFMALVQKLTGQSRSADNNEATNHQPKQDPKQSNSDQDQKNLKNMNNDDNDSSSVLTDENNCSSNLGDVHMNSSSSSCFVPPMMFDPSHNHPCFSNIPIFAPNTADFLCSAQPFYSYSDSLFLMPNMRSSVNCSTLDTTKEFREF